MQLRNFKSYTIEEFESFIEDLKFKRQVTHIQIHHTWKPTKVGYLASKDKEQVIRSMWVHHTVTNGWKDIGQHLTVSPDGLIWDGRSLEQDPAGIEGHNKNGICIEIIGDFDIGREKLEGIQLEAVTRAVFLLQKKFNTREIVFHREHAAKSCPGTSINKDWFLEMVKRADIPKKDTLEESLKILAGKGVINTPDYWLQNAVAGKTINGEYAGTMIKRVAEKLKGV